MTVAESLGIERALEQAIAHHQAGNIAAARAAYQAILARDPHHSTALEYAGVAALQMHDFAAGYAALSAAVQARPHDLELLGNCALAAARVGRLAEARTGLSRVAEATGSVAAYVNLGNVCEQMGDRAAAASALRLAVSKSPNNVEALSNLGRVLTQQRAFDEALATLIRAAELNPHHASAALNLANAYKDAGDMLQATPNYDRAIRVKPAYLQAHSAAILAACYQPLTCDQWRARLAGFAAQLPSANRSTMRAKRLADGRIHVAMVSADFRTHAVAHYLEGLLPALDRRRFAVSLYHNHTAEDAVSQKLRAYVDSWVPAIGIEDAALAAHMRERDVAIALDLSGHSAGNRLRAFALRLAPIQATWLGFLGSSGVPAMDYRLTDGVLDPPGAEAWHTEQLLRLPGALWCYSAMGAQPVFPEAGERQFTFACLNNPAKLSAGVLALWGQLLRELPTSTLLLHAHEYAPLRMGLTRALCAEGARAEQIAFQGFTSRETYGKTLATIDVALDPFPYSGGTTTCDALYAGVPVVALAEPSTPAQPFARTAASCLTAAGLTEYVATSVHDYLAKARALAARGPRDALARRDLHARVTVSPLMNASLFARGFETALETLFASHA